MHIPVCELHLATDHAHIRQIVSGFVLLDRAGLINLRFTWAKQLPDTHPERSFLTVLVDGTPIAYDVADDYYFDQATTERHLADVKLYFKRSFDPKTHANWAHADRMRPLGLNYHVEARHRAFPALDRAEPKAYLRLLAARAAHQERRPLVERLEAPPTLAAAPTVMFQARMWDPRGESTQTAPSEVQERRHALNELRANCVRLLRRLGPRVTAGIQATPYALATYPDLISGRSATSKRKYLERMHATDICVATLGLGDSNGWKLGEYVAASRAIVTERLRYQVPGGFVAKTNYLAFSTGQECAEHVATLMSDPEATHAMQCANYAYYKGWVRPDQLVLRTLEQAVSGRDV